MDNRRDDHRDYRDRSQGSGSRDRGRRPRPMLEYKEIRRWRRIRTIMDRARESGKSFVEMIVDMERPEFDDGTLGYYRLNTLIVVDERTSLRLNTSALGILRRFFSEHDTDIQAALSRVRRQNFLIDEKIRVGESDDRFKGLDEDQGDSAQDPEDLDDEDEGEDGEDDEEEPSEEEPDEEDGNRRAPEPGNGAPERRRTRRPT